jgi:predicted HicB family RNase H-like nuclease
MKWGQDEFRGMTIQIPVKLRDRLVAASKRRGVSINTLINTALVHWLAEQGDVTIKGKTSGKS